MKSNDLTFEQRVNLLEEKFGQGTIISRVLGDRGYYWCFGLGKVSMPKSFYYGETMEEALFNAENNIGKETSWADLGVSV